jgi:hypothetical protein
VKVGVDALRKATFVAAGLVVATGVPTLVLAFGNGGSAQPAHHSVASGHSPQPVTAAGSSDSSTSTSTTSQPADSTLSTTDTAATGTTKTSVTLPSTTTVPPPPPCQWSQFTVTVTTQGSYFTEGQAVPFTITAENTGPACTDQGQEHCGCWGAYAENSAGQIVWVMGAPDPPSSFVSVSSPPAVVPAHWSTANSFEWDQSQCTSSADCPKSQVHPGTYDIIGLWADHVAPKPDASAPVSVTILPLAAP